MKLRARNLAIGYGTKIVGEGIDIEVASGEILCLLGPNGCGKTTLFRTLLALIPALAGEILLGGRSLSAESRASIARAIAYVPQAHIPPFPYRALDIVLMGRTARLGLFTQPGATDHAQAHAALARLGIAGLGKADYTQLSRGQRQLVLIARALAQQAPLMVMDEPTASLDFGNQARVLAEFAKLAGGGGDALGVILSTHDPDQAFALGAKVLLMKAGAILASGRPELVLTSPALSEVYGVPVAVERTESGRLVCLPPLAKRSAAGPAPDEKSRASHQQAAVEG
jgi:iron complex transport system ATP-binding protein